MTDLDEQEPNDDVIQDVDPDDLPLPDTDPVPNDEQTHEETHAHE